MSAGWDVYDTALTHMIAGWVLYGTDLAQHSQNGKNRIYEYN